MNLILGQTCLLLTLLGSVPGRAQAHARSTNLNETSLEVAALELLHDLELTPAQLTALGKLARESAPAGKPPQAAKASPAFAAALAGLHAALGRGDDNQIGDAREKVDALMQKEEPELDDGIVITQGARGNAPQALKILNARQIGVLLGTLEVTDPVELLVTAMDQVRNLPSSKDADEEIATVAEEAAWLVHGDNDEEAQKTREKVAILLRKAGNFKDNAAFAAQRKVLEKEARETVGEVDNLEVISHILEHGMAELLSNPRLEAAIRIQSRVASHSAATRKVRTSADQSTRPSSRRP
jgi:hypothetical protein